MVRSWIAPAPAHHHSSCIPRVVLASSSTPSAPKPTQNGSAVLYKSPMSSPLGSSATQAAKLQLLQMASGFDRGALASTSSKQHIGKLVSELEASYTPPTLQGLQDGLAGRWQLVYSSVEQFRSSPFFWAFQEGLVGNRSVAGAIFAFTDSIPGARVGEAYQTLSFTNQAQPAGRLLSEVKLEVFPGLSGFVVTDSVIRSLEPSGTIMLTIESTRVSNTNVTPFLEGIVVPVEQIIDTIRNNTAATDVTAMVSYLDDNLRVTRTADDAIFVYCRA